MNKRERRRPRKQEERLAEQVGGTRHSGSGNGDWRKNDVRSDDYYIEAKCRAKSDAKQITIRLKDLQDVALNAAVKSRTPILAFELGGVDYFIVESGEFLAGREDG